MRFFTHYIQSSGAEERFYLSTTNFLDLLKIIGQYANCYKHYAAYKTPTSFNNTVSLTFEDDYEARFFFLAAAQKNIVFTVQDKNNLTIAFSKSNGKFYKYCPEPEINLDECTPRSIGA